VRRSPLLFLLAAACASAQKPAPTPNTTTPITQAPNALLADTSRAIAYSGYREGQHPDRGDGEVAPSDDQLLEDLKILVAADFTLIRLYDSGALSTRVLKLIAAHDLPIRVMLGAWLQAELSNHEGCAWLTEPIPEAELAANTKANGEEVQRVIALANQYPRIVVAVNVGNEALVTWNDHLVALDAMLAYMKTVKAAIAQPVTTADNYVVWREQGAALMTVADFAAIHTYPAWENKTIDEAMAYTIENLQGVRDAIPAAQLVIAEAGWATTAVEFPTANEANQTRYFRELMAWAKTSNVTTFFFEAFDEPWKGHLANPDGAEKHWGLWFVDRTPKAALKSLQ
jgi:exo-beta-1,3-glucanase (GH17 family)